MKNKTSRNFVFKYFWKTNIHKIHSNKKKKSRKHKSRDWRDFNFTILFS